MRLFRLVPGFLLFLIFQTTSCQEHVLSCDEIDGTTIVARREIQYFKSTNWPEPPGSDWAACEFRIITEPPGKPILINFTSFNVEFPNRVVVFDSNRSTADVFTDSYSNPPSFVSQTDDVIFRVINYTDYTGTGFFASFQVFKDSMMRDTAPWCMNVRRYIITPGSMLVGSPFWPYWYRGNEYCRAFFIELNDGKIQLKFHKFELESKDLVDTFDEVPGNDTLIIIDGREEVARYNYSSIPSNYISKSRTIELVFSSDSVINGPGFVVTMQTLCESLNNSFVRALSSPRRITSPQWPFFPGSDWIECAYKIKAVTERIIFVFDEFNVDFPNRVVIYDEDKSSAGVFFGTYDKQPSFISNTNTVIFKTKNETEFSGTGFSATYQFFARAIRARTAPCGFSDTATNKAKSLNSPNWPYWYSGSQTCTWTLSTNKGRKIWIKFNEFELESKLLVNTFTEAPGDDALIIYENDVEIVRYNYQSKPTEYISTSNEVKLVFITDNMVNGPGFSAIYRNEFVGSLFQG